MAPPASGQSQARSFGRRGEVEAKKKIVRYLRAGARVHEYVGYSHCRFPDGPPDEEMGDADLTDGSWIWPEGLWIYVGRYSVILPEEFVHHMRSNRFEIPRDLDVEQSETVPIDLEFWRSWCKRVAQRS